MVNLPEGGHLVPKRADSPSTSGIITDEMFRDILCSRIVLADITGVNPNVFYELGVRHALRPTSTVVIKETHVDIPFDVRNLVNIYLRYWGVRSIGNAIQTIRTCLEESLKNNSFDSPVVAALKDDLEWPNYDIKFLGRYKLESWTDVQTRKATVDEYINEAQWALNRGEIEAAIASCKGARMLEPDSLHINMQLKCWKKQ